MRDHGLRVPEDISVVGFDDIQSAAFHNPSLTTIRQPLHEMGTIAARIAACSGFAARMRCPRMLSVLPELVIRESTCPPPSSAQTAVEAHRKRLRSISCSGAGYARCKADHSPVAQMPADLRISLLPAP